MTFFRTVIVTLATLCSLQLAFANPQLSPDALVRNATRDTLEMLKKEPNTSSKAFREFVDNKIIGVFDFNRITQLAVGKNWRQATPEQKAQLTVEFRTLLVRTYSAALTAYKNAVVETKPLRPDPAANTVVVRTEVTTSNGTVVPIDYSLEKSSQGWKIYDVQIEGVSLVTNYRKQFNDTVSAGGIDALIKWLADRNNTLANGGKAKAA